jgi:hypothetical protein
VTFNIPKESNSNQSFWESVIFRARKSAIANGNKINPPIKNRKKLICIGGIKLLIILLTTS